MLSDQQKHLVNLIQYGELRTFDRWVATILLRSMGVTNFSSLFIDDVIHEDFAEMRVFVAYAGDRTEGLNTWDNVPYVDDRLFETYMQTLQYLYNHDLICLFKNVNRVDYGWTNSDPYNHSLRNQIVEWSEYDISGYVLKDRQISVTSALQEFIKNDYRTDSQVQIAQARNYMIITVIISILTFAVTFGYEWYKDSKRQTVAVDSISGYVISRPENNATPTRTSIAQVLMK